MTPTAPTAAPTPAEIRAKMRRRSRMMRALNVPMRGVLSLPFPTPLGRRLMLVTHIGRKTGRAYRQPVSYVRDGDTLLTPGGGAWTRNLREGQPINARLAGKKVQLRPDLVSDPDEVVSLLERMATANPGITRFVPFYNDDRQIDRTKLQNGIEYGFRVVRWHLV